MKRQRPKRLGIEGVQVHVLPVSVGIEQVIAHPAGVEVRQPPRVERERDLVAVARDDEAVVPTEQELPDVPETGIGAGMRPPQLRAPDAAIIVDPRELPVGRVVFGVAAEMQVGRFGLKPRHPRGPIARSHDADPVPVDLHVGHDPDARIGRGDLPREIHGHRLREPGRKAERL